MLPSSALWALRHASRRCPSADISRCVQATGCHARLGLRAIAPAPSTALARSVHVVWPLSRPASTAAGSADTTAGVTPAVSIGDVSIPMFHAANPDLVPSGYLPAAGAGSLPQSTLAHLRWLMQKDRLGQDVFLLGPPGAERRRLIMAYCELVGREVEYVAVSRDTTDAERREILGGRLATSLRKGEHAQHHHLLLRLPEVHAAPPAAAHTHTNQCSGLHHTTSSPADTHHTHRLR